MNAYETQNLIISKLLGDGWIIESCSYAGRGPLVATKKFARIEITTEECLCHGGRLWIHDTHTSNYFELSHECYDESLGITDSSSELKYIIENEMLPKIKEFDSFIYKLTIINKYGKNVDGTTKEDVTYYNNQNAVVCRITDDHECHEELLGLEKHTTQYPNPDYSLVIERIYKKEEYSWEKNRLWFKAARRIKKDGEWQIENEWEMYVSIFSKQ
jgi:hypothetical protein